MSPRRKIGGWLNIVCFCTFPSCSRAPPQWPRLCFSWLLQHCYVQARGCVNAAPPSNKPTAAATCPNSADAINGGSSCACPLGSMCNATQCTNASGQYTFPASCATCVCFIGLLQSTHAFYSILIHINSASRLVCVRPNIWLCVVHRKHIHYSVDIRECPCRWCVSSCAAE